MALAAEHFVGRAEELGALDAALEDASRGRPRALAVLGDAGIGKTRLLAELAHGAGEDEVPPPVGAVRELGELAGLADPGVAQHRQRPWPAAGRVLQRGVQRASSSARPTKCSAARAMGGVLATLSEACRRG